MKIISLFITTLLIFTIGKAQFFRPQSVVGKQMTAHSLQDINDSIVNIFDSKEGKYTLIDMYFNACKPCNANIPKIKKLQEKFGTKLCVVSLNKIDSKEAIIKHKAENKTSFIDLHGKAASYIFEQFGIKQYDTMGYPTYILVAPNGTVLFGSGNNLNWHKKIAKLIK